MISCYKCGKIIPEGRLKALPTATTCIDCSNVGRKVGFQIIDGKTTYSELEIVESGSQAERTLARMQRKHFGAQFMFKSLLCKEIKMGVEIHDRKEIK